MLDSRVCHARSAVWCQRILFSVSILHLDLRRADPGIIVYWEPGSWAALPGSRDHFNVARMWATTWRCASQTIFTKRSICYETVLSARLRPRNGRPLRAAQIKYTADPEWGLLTTRGVPVRGGNHPDATEGGVRLCDSPSSGMHSRTETRQESVG